MLDCAILIIVISKIELFLKIEGYLTMDHIDHILIVDDDREIRELVASYLKKNGLRVDCRGGWAAHAGISRG